MGPTQTLQARLAIAYCTTHRHVQLPRPLVVMVLVILVRPTSITVFSFVLNCLLLHLQTIQTVATIVASLIDHRNKNGEKKAKGQNPTLIVCPPSAMLQWADEFSRSTEPGTVSILPVYGKRDSLTMEKLMEHDVILTTYNVLEYEYRKIVNNAKVACEYCSKRLLPRSLQWHNKYFCGPDAHRTLKQAKQEQSKRKETTLKAMQTLKITKPGEKLPATAGGTGKKRGARSTPMAIYNDLMAEANRQPLQMYDAAPSAADEADGKGGSATLATKTKAKPAANPNSASSKRTRGTAGEPQEANVAKPAAPKRRKGAKSKAAAVDSAASINLVVVEDEQDVKAKAAAKPKTGGTNKPTNKPTKAPAPQSDVYGMKVAELRAELTSRGLDATGVKAKLQARLAAALEPAVETIEAIVEEPEMTEPEHTRQNKRGKKMARTKQVARKSARAGVGAATAADDASDVEDDETSAQANSAAANAVDSTSPAPTEDDSGRRSTRLRSKPRVSLEGMEGSYKTWKDGDDSDFDAAEKEKEEKVYSSEDSGSDPEFVAPSEEASTRGQGGAGAVDSGSDDDDQEYSDASEGDSDSRLEVRKRRKRGAPRKRAVSEPASATKPSKSADKVGTTKKGKSATNSKGKGATKKSSSAKGKGKLAVDSSNSSSDESDSGPAPPRQFATKGKFTDKDGLDMHTSLLHCLEWKRIVLDEAHKIKSRTNSTAKAIYALKGEVRWCITGTPMQNRVGELYALIRFLQSDPFAYYFCSKKGCDCKTINWCFGPKQRQCTDCGCPPMKHFAYFNKHIINPIKRYGYVGLGREGMLMLKNEVLDKVMLRRTKKERASELKLPALDIEVIHLQLSPDEKDFYDCIYKQTRSRFDTFVDKGTLLHNYAHVFELLSRLRQATDHPYLVIHGKYKGTS